MNIKATKLTPPRNVSIRRKNKIHFREVTCKKNCLGIIRNDHDRASLHKSAVSSEPFGILYLGELRMSWSD